MFLQVISRTGSTIYTLCRAHFYLSHSTVTRVEWWKVYIQGVLRSNNNIYIFIYLCDPCDLWQFMGVGLFPMLACSHMSEPWSLELLSWKVGFDHPFDDPDRLRLGSWRICLEPQGCWTLILGHGQVADWNHGEQIRSWLWIVTLRTALMTLLYYALICERS